MMMLMMMLMIIMMMSWIREDIKKICVFLSDIVQKGGGGVQPESKSFQVFLFSLSLTFFWTCSKSFEALFCLNIVYIFEIQAYTKVTSRLSKIGRYKSYLTDVQNEGWGVKATFGQCQKERRFFMAFLISRLRAFQTLKNALGQSFGVTQKDRR